MIRAIFTANRTIEANLRLLNFGSRYTLKTAIVDRQQRPVYAMTRISFTGVEDGVAWLREQPEMELVKFEEISDKATMILSLAPDPVAPRSLIDTPENHPEDLPF